jgi:ferredoxin--NADP+ reductase
MGDNTDNPAGCLKSEAAESPRGARVAIIGAGPSGLYAVQSLLELVPGLGIDVFDKLPTPYGLVRYGIAPDNQKMKSVTRALCTAFDRGSQVRLFGNVKFGMDISRVDLLKHYDSIIYATGAQGERRLGIPGEDLPGSHSAKEFVDWYNGHPDASERSFHLNAPQVAVVGAGNVSLDVVRMLAHGPDEIALTDVPNGVLDAFRNSQVADVHLIVRRGPAQAKFTPVELRAIDDLSNADVIVRPEELLLTDGDEALVNSNRELRTNVARLREWAQRPLRSKPRRIHIRFLRRPVRILGHRRVEGVLLESNEIIGDGRMRGTGRMEILEAGMVIRAVGYQALPLPDVPFDEAKSTIPHDRGRVMAESGKLANREYVTGWAKRGPSGTVGTNKSDSDETVRGLVADFTTRGSYGGRSPGQILALLDSRGVAYTDWVDWLRLDSHEIQCGRRQCRPRVKVPDQRSMLELCRRTGAPGCAPD